MGLTRCQDIKNHTSHLEVKGHFQRNLDTLLFFPWVKLLSCPPLVTISTLLLDLADELQESVFVVWCSIGNIGPTGSY